MCTSPLPRPLAFRTLSFSSPPCPSRPSSSSTTNSTSTTRSDPILFTLNPTPPPSPPPRSFPTSSSSSSFSPTSFNSSSSRSASEPAPSSPSLSWSPKAGESLKGRERQLRTLGVADGGRRRLVLDVESGVRFWAVRRERAPGPAPVASGFKRDRREEEEEQEQGGEKRVKA